MAQCPNCGQSQSSSNVIFWIIGLVVAAVLAIPVFFVACLVVIAMLGAPSEPDFARVVEQMENAQVEFDSSSENVQYISEGNDDSSDRPFATKPE